MFIRQKNQDSIKCIPKYSLILCMGMEMYIKKLQQTLLTNLFKTIIRIEKRCFAKKVEGFNESAEQKTPMLERVEKTPYWTSNFFCNNTTI